MRHDLPPRPHLEHLKKQAKQLLHGHATGDPAALQRIHETLPALRDQSVEQIARAEFALHDAQSVIAREYGFASWQELRAAVAQKSSTTFSEANALALLRFSLPPLFSPAVFAAMRTVDRTLAAQALASELPARQPLVPVRDMLVQRPSLTPLMIGRPASMAAVKAAWAQTPRTLVLFAQHSAFDEQPTAEHLHPIGCQALLHDVLAVDGHSDFAYIVVEALRAVRLDAFEAAASPGDATYARVQRFDVDTSGPSDDRTILEQRLRAHAHRLATILPEPQPAREIIDSLDDVDLANTVVQNLPLSLAVKAQFAAEPRLIERLRLALRWLEALPSP